MLLLSPCWQRWQLKPLPNWLAVKHHFAPVIQMSSPDSACVSPSQIITAGSQLFHFSCTMCVQDIRFSINKQWQNVDEIHCSPFCIKPLVSYLRERLCPWASLRWWKCLDCELLDSLLENTPWNICIILVHIDFVITSNNHFYNLLLDFVWN